MRCLFYCFVVVLLSVNTFAQRPEPFERPENASEGRPGRTSVTTVTGTKDPGLFVGEHWGMRAFSCKIPNGKYLAKLYFAETFAGVSGPGQRVFSFKFQGQEFRDFDIWEKAGGFRRAYVETVPVEVTNGEFRIDFTAQTENPAINAIEIVSKAEDAMASPETAIRIKAGQSTPFTDSSGQVWQPDQGFEGGGMSQAFWTLGRGPGGEGPGEFAQSFLKYDSDNNGGIEIAELPPSLKFLFPRIDRHEDGQIDGLELVQLENFVATEPDGQQLRSALTADPPSTETVRRLQEVLDSMALTETTNEAQIDAAKRSEWLSYSFTVGAMLIAVVSFGHLLATPPPNGSRWAQTDSSPTAIRPVLVSLGLICVLSLIDLFWTTVRFGNFHFQEMNPLGSQLLLDGSSPLVFKIATMAASVLLLFVLRRYRGAQVASWWMCMVCTLLTFRWIVLDSAILS